MSSSSETRLARVGERIEAGFDYRCQRCRRPVLPEYGWISLPKCPQCSHVRYEMTPSRAVESISDRAVGGRDD
jgi:hypothetical protein